MRVMLGYDPREHAAYVVARYSIERRASRPVRVSPIHLYDLQRAGIYRRPMGRRGMHQLWDVYSDAPMSTEFAISRFFIPHLVDSDHDDWILFADSDIVCYEDIADLFALADPSKAIMVVKHILHGDEVTKKIDQTQTQYPFKNWSSVMLWNIRHPAHRALSLDYLNTVPGRDLHAFKWLDHDLIGILPFRWNWLVNVEAKPDDIAIAHFTLGGPWLVGWRGADYDILWLNERSAYDAVVSASYDVAGEEIIDEVSAGS